MPVLLQLSCAPFLFACGEGRMADDPNLLLITVDTLRADRLGCYGYFRPTSPTIDRLASEAILFERVVTPMTTTLPAHVSLMTSTLPIQHGVKRNYHLLRRPANEWGLRSVAEMLRDQGYATAAFVSSASVKRATGIGIGFQEFDEPEGPDRRADATTDEVLAWLGPETRRPFYLWIHYFDPHGPYEPPPPYDALFAADDDLAGFLTARGIPPPHPPRILDLHNGYDGEVRFADDQIARVLDRVRELGLYDDTVVVLTSDHGEGLGQHDWWGHGRIYNEQLLVPWVLRLPRGGGLRGARRTNIVSLIDLLPTLAEITTLPFSAEDRRQFRGVNALSSRAERRFAFAERTRRVRQGWTPGTRYALAGGRWKYLHRTAGPDELYDLERDPFELRNLIHQHPEVARALKDRILDLLETHRPRNAGQEAAEQQDQKLIEELESLGYL